MPVVSGYQLVRRIEGGGSSTVYEARQAFTNISCAVKVLNRRLEDDEQRANFEHECEIIGRFHGGRGVVNVLTAAQTEDGYPCIVMELCQGTFEGTAPMSAAEVTAVGIRLAEGLQAIHDSGVVHRDIKPENIFVTDRGPAIGDFGISSVVDRRTQEGAAGFSADYAPPEVFEEGGSGQLGDVYSLGATLHQLLTGEVPFPPGPGQDNSTPSVVQRLVSTPAPMVRRVDVPEPLARLLHRCLEKRAGDRPTSARMVADELRAIQQQQGWSVDADTIRRGGTTPTLPPDAGLGVDAPRAQPRRDTVVRGTSAPDRIEPVLGAPTDTTPERRRWVPWLVGVVGLGGAAFVTSLAVSGGGDGDDAATTTTSDPVGTTAAAPEFVVLTPPTDLTVEGLGGDTYRLDWTEVDPALSYQLLLVGTEQNEVVDAPPFEWTIDPDGTACFEIKTVDPGVGVSQSSTGPVCG